jgi:hypothetical protein
VEVKSSKNYTTTSLSSFKEKFGKKVEKSYIIHPKNFLEENDVIKIPPYMIWCVFAVTKKNARWPLLDHRARRSFLGIYKSNFIDYQ